MLDNLGALTDSNYIKLRTPGRIQGNGVLLTLHPRTLRVIAASENAGSMFGIDQATIQGAVVTGFMGPEPVAEELRAAAAEDYPNFINPLPAEIGGRKFDAVFHLHDGLIVGEFEPLAPGAPTRADLDRLADETVAGMLVPDTLDGLLQTAPRIIREATGFDRVMLYRFDEAYRGQVIGEARRDGIDSYFGLHFPDSDIGPAARQLYEQNFCRYIPRVDGPSVRVVPADNPLTGRPLDLSHAMLRGVAPCHTEYLVNIGVAASMSYSIMSEGKLWGLFACHHYEPARLSYVQRQICEQVAMLFVAKLEEMLNPAAQAEEMERRRAEALGDTPICAPDPLEVDWTEAQEAALLRLVDAAGASIYWDGKVGQIGACPDLADLHDYITRQPEVFARLVHMYDDGGLFYSSAIAGVLPFGAKMREKGSGLMVVPLSRQGHRYLLWFRPEQVIAATWGGNPNVGHGTDPDARFSPRKSFAAWKEDIRDRAEPWTNLQIANAMALRDHVVGQRAGG